MAKKKTQYKHISWRFQKGPYPQKGWVAQYGGGTHGGRHTTIEEACATLRKAMGLGARAKLPLRAPRKHKARQTMPAKFAHRVRCLLRYAAAREAQVPSAVGPADLASSLAHARICKTMYSAEPALHFTSLGLKYHPCKSWLHEAWCSLGQRRQCRMAAMRPRVQRMRRLLIATAKKMALHRIPLAWPQNCNRFRGREQGPSFSQGPGHHPQATWHREVRLLLRQP